jgi:c-di-GMP-related signal transduction protein
MTPQERDEKQYGEVDVVLLYIEEARRRAERAAEELRAGGAEDFLVEAIEQTQEQLSQAAKKLIQGTFFAVPSAQLTL